MKIVDFDYHLPGLEICLKYNISAEDFVDQWIAFTASKLSGAAPTVDHLETMERKELQKSKDTPRQRLATPKQNYGGLDDLYPLSQK